MSALPDRDLVDSLATLTPHADRQGDAFEPAWAKRHVANVPHTQPRT
jgi:hypothetical protein